MDYEKYIDVEVVVQNGTYSDSVTLDTAKFMMDADIVTVRETSVTVKEIEVTDKGVIRFHGNLVQL